MFGVELQLGSNWIWFIAPASLIEIHADVEHSGGISRTVRLTLRT